MDYGELLLLAGALLATGIAASLVAGSLRVPGLIVVLGLAMAIGSDGLGLIHFGGTESDVELARTIGVIALVFILFEGGLASGWGEIRPVLRTSVMLAIFATVAQAVIVGLAAAWLLDLTTEEGLLLGSIVSATDSAAIFSVLRGSSLKKRLARILEGESGMNDPVAIVLVLGFIEFIQDPAYTLADMALPGRGRAGAGCGDRPRDRPGGRDGVPERADHRPRPVPCRVAGLRRAGVRHRRRGARVRVHRRVPRGAGAGQRLHPRQAHHRRVPRRPGLDQPDRHVHDPWAAGQPVRSSAG